MTALDGLSKWRDGKLLPLNKVKVEEGLISDIAISSTFFSNFSQHFMSFTSVAHNIFREKFQDNRSFVKSCS